MTDLSSNVNEKNRNISIRNRFITIIILFFSAFIIFALFTDKAARVTVKDSQLQIRNLQEVGITVGDISNSLHLLGIAMYQATLFNKSDQPEIIQQHLTSLSQQVGQLINLPSVQSNPALYKPALHLADSLRGLTVQSKKMLDISNDFKLKYPAMPIMLDKLRPINQEMMGLITLSIDEANDLLDSRDEQEKILRLLKDVRYIWSQLVSSVRVFVANRLGAFGPPEQTMTLIQRDNVLYTEVITDLLNQLDVFDKNEYLGFVQQDSLVEMKKLHKEYQDEFLKAKKIYLSENWRADKTLLRDELNPSLSDAWAQVYLISNKINAHSQYSMNKYANTADTFSNYIWIAVLIFMGLLLIGYLSFEFLIRRPIVDISKALDAEGNGDSLMPALKYRVKETDVLLRAFGGMRQQIHARQTRLQSILDNACEGILTISQDGKIETINKAGCHLFGFSEKDLTYQLVTCIIPAYAEITEKVSVPLEREVFGVCKDGRTFPMALRIGRTIIEGKIIYTALVSDISDRKIMIDRLTQLAERDSLTGLYNRHFLMDELDRIIDRSARGEKQSFALLYIDLDHFKFVNDNFGHLAGDTVLQEVTKILLKRARGTDLVTRLGGDEFVIILYEVDENQAKAAASAYRQQLADYTFNFKGKTADVGCSIGVVIYDFQVKKKEDVLSQADLACHLAKQTGRNNVKVYRAKDQQETQKTSFDMGWSSRIKQAIENDDFFQDSQPIIDVKSGLTLTHEVLLRLNDKKNNIIMPSGFMPLAERFGLSVEIDHWVIKQSFQHLSRQSSRCFSGYSINLSVHSIENKSTLKFIEDTAKEFKINRSQITFEINESCWVNHIELAKPLINGLRELGFKTLLDGFGVGQTSFNLLKALPVDYIKFDGVFIQNLRADKVNITMLKAMNDVAHALGIKTIAEFVEDAYTLNVLTKIEVDYCQGYFMGRPEAILQNTTNIHYLAGNL